MQNINGLCNVSGLGRFVAASLQKHHRAVLDGVIDAQAASEKETKLEEVLAELGEVAKVAIFNPGQSGQDLELDRSVFQPGEPLVVLLRALQFVFHVVSVSFRKQIVKR